MVDRLAGSIDWDSYGWDFSNIHTFRRTPPEHKRYLSRRDFEPITLSGLTVQEVALLGRHGHWVLMH